MSDKKKDTQSEPVTLIVNKPVHKTVLDVLRDLIEIAIDKDQGDDADDERKQSSR